MTGYVNSIYVQAAGSDLVGAVIAQVTRTLARRHHIQAGRGSPSARRRRPR